MSVAVTKVVNLPQAALKFLVPDEIEDAPVQECDTIGGVFSDSDYAWLSNGPRLEIIHTKIGSKIGAWTFGWVLKDSNTQVVCVDEIQRPHGRLPLLAVGLDCDLSGGMICIFDFVSSKIIRAIHIKDKITSLHVIDAGYDVFTLPGPLQTFDGIIAVGTAGGDVVLVDICRQICDEALTTGGLNEIRDEINPCFLCYITSKDLAKIEHHKEFAIRNSHHLAIHLNVVFDQSTKHFVLKGPKGDDRIIVNKDEVTVSALYYCPQLRSLLVGYNFGAFQLYNLMNLDLVYTSRVCDEHIPISHFAVQEPADDPRAVCYVWTIYSTMYKHPTCLPLAVMYAFCYQSKEYHEGYGCLYQIFTSASVHYQMELGVPYGHKRKIRQRGGNCLKVKSITQGSVNKDGLHHDSSEDSLTLCVFVWNVLFSNKETDTFLSIFDLDQWYKEQMPGDSKTRDATTYMLEIYLNEIIDSASSKSAPILDVHVDKNSMQQFTGAQRLEEHFYPNSITFGMTCLRESDVVFLQNYSVQKALLAHIESSGPLCLVEPAEVHQEVIGLGLVPLFIDLPINTPITTNQQREIILGAALENHLMGWLCKCASEWANGSFFSAGCSLDVLIAWAFQRAITLKTNCDNFCTSLFDYSEARLDNNTNILLNSCTRQLKNLCSLYAFIITKLPGYISNPELVGEQFKSLETVSVYFEVLQWLLNVGLLPECPLAAYPRSDDLERISAPYPAEMLIEFYNHRRAVLKTLNEENFKTSDSSLFIDALIERECGGKALQEQWRQDGGNGLYPPPSLQALLRTYLIENVDFSYKHTVIIYVFLDLAMTLDQDRYKPVITHLIKFPAVFKVSPSVIKITQAFWQLDHCDFNTSMGLLLDPLISMEDLHSWHHKVVLRSLMLQKQHNYALLYIQVRKPVLKDEDDILSAISLYVANNMLDEAFYFEKHFTSQNHGTKFLLHLFNECKKNDKLGPIIYRSLEPNDEHFFLKYLINSKQPVADDLHVYYHLLRSHFIEAFESHERTMPTQIENMGLMGQQNAIPRDKVIHAMKKILPAVNRNLLNFCHKERNNIWQHVSRPTPMSVFVHNPTENVKYKSTVLGAALAKAKQTFNETVNRAVNMETEGTPFLRTPTVATGSKRSAAVIVNPRIIDTDLEEPCSPPSAKRLKLSPRLSASLTAPIPSKLSTPLVKRKTPRFEDKTEERKIVTPQSILKVKNLLNHTTSKHDVVFEDDLRDFEKVEYTPVTSQKKSGLGLSPRKSLAKLPVVRFEGLNTSSSSSLNNTRSSLEKLVEAPENNIVSSSKSASTEDEVFYSADTSLEDKEQQTIDEQRVETSSVEESVEVAKIEKNEISPEKAKPNIVFSPRGRRSYKRSLEPTTPVRSSPRLLRNTLISKETLESSPRKLFQNEDISEMKVSVALDKESPRSSIGVDKSVAESPKSTRKIEQSVVELPRNMEQSIEESPRSSTEDDKSVVESPKSTKKLEQSVVGSPRNMEQSIEESPKSSPVLPKLRPRKSLCRQVLESNTRIRVLNSPVESPKSRRSKKIVTPKLTKVEESAEKVVLESTTKYEDGEATQKSSLLKKHNLTMSLMESDADSSQDFSFDFGVVEGPKMSDSMLQYINSSNKSLSTGSVFEESTVNEDSKTNDPTETAEKSLLGDEIGTEYSHPAIAGNATEIEEQLEDVPTKDTSELQEEQIDANSTFDRSKSIVYSVFDATTEIFAMSGEASGLKLSDSVVRCIENREESINQTGDEIEIMDVDDDDIDVIEDVEDKDKNEELYTNLASSNLDEAEKRPPSAELFEEISSTNKVKEDNVETFDGESSNRPIDPEMNVFEISDDLSFNDGLLIEKEVTLEENDLCYGQQNTLENVLEENMIAVSSPLNVFEKNVFNGSSASEEESDEESDQEPQVDTPDEDRDKSEEPVGENEVIEIGSSSEEERNNSGEEVESSRSESRSSEYDQSDEEKPEGSYEGGIYDSEEEYFAETVYQGQYEDISEVSNTQGDETNEGFGLFEGDIVFVEEESDKSSKNGEKEDNQDGEDQDLAQPAPVICETVAEEKQEEINFVQDPEQELINENVGEKEENKGEDKLEESKDEAVEVVSYENISDCEQIELSKIGQENPAEQKDVDSNVLLDKVNEETKYEMDGLIEMSKIGPETQAEEETMNPIVFLDKVGEEIKDSSGEMDELHYSIPDEENADHTEETIQEKKRRESEENGRVSRHSEREEEKVQDTEAFPTEKEPEDKNPEEIVESRCPLDETLPEPVIHDRPSSRADRDILDLTQYPDKASKQRTRSSSVSSTSKKSARRGYSRTIEEDTESVPKQKRVTRSSADILTIMEATILQPEPDIIEDLLKTTQPVRVLRSRTVSTDESPAATPPSTLRKRSSSVDEIKSDKDESTTKEESRKTRGRRASSVVHLPKIAEEATPNKSKSSVEGYSMSRRVTRQQATLLKKMDEKLEFLDPIVLLDKGPFEGKPDPEEQKVYETSPTSSTASSNVKPARRLRSASQTSDTSQRSKSKTPVRTLKTRTRTNSTDEAPNQSGTSARKKLQEVFEEATEDVDVNRPATRSRTKSVSSVNSEDLSVSENVKLGKRKQRVSSQTALPEIKEEVAKKRTRKNSQK